ncbi:MAG: phosphate ABC transporter substrate-binding protein [Candidatus Binatia bacterium]
MGLAVAFAFQVATAGNPEAADRLVVTGSSTLAPLMAEIGRRYEEQHPGVRIDVQAGGSSRGIHDVREGLADIGMVSRALEDSEKDLKAVTVALDGIGMIVHSDNPVKELTEQQIVNIYTGAVTDWGQLGVPPGPISAVGKAEGRATLEIFLAHFHLTVDRLRVQVVIGDNQQGIKTVAANPGGIGYVSIGSARYEIDHGAPLRLLPMSGVAASAENVRAGSYPVARSLLLVTSASPRPAVSAFLAFAQSNKVLDLVASQYFVAVGE